MGCCVTLEGTSTIIVAIYRPRSQAATTSFFVEISTLFELLVTYSLPVIVTGDVNIHFERSKDSDTMKLVQILDSFDFEQFVKSPTHYLGGVLDVIITQTGLVPEDVVVTDVGLSDHMLVM